MWDAITYSTCEINFDGSNLLQQEIHNRLLAFRPGKVRSNEKSLGIFFISQARFKLVTATGHRQKTAGPKNPINPTQYDL